MNSKDYHSIVLQELVSPCSAIFLLGGFESLVLFIVFGKFLLDQECLEGSSFCIRNCRLILSLDNSMSLDNCRLIIQCILLLNG